MSLYFYRGSFRLSSLMNRLCKLRLLPWNNIPAIMTCLAPNSRSLFHYAIGKTVLLVEPDRANRDAVANVLESEGYQVIQALDGEKALQIWQSNSSNPDFDLIVLEMTLREYPTYAKSRNSEQPVEVCTAQVQHRIH